MNNQIPSVNKKTLPYCYQPKGKTQLMKYCEAKNCNIKDLCGFTEIHTIVTNNKEAV